MNSDIDVIKSSPIDNFQMMKYLGPTTKIIKYSDLKNYNTIEQLLPLPLDFVIILIEQEKNNGHWVCVSRINNEIEFFDSYNNYPDTQLKWTPLHLRELLNQKDTYLSDLLDKTNKKVYYNEIQYQSNKDDIATCGRHVIFRLMKLKEGLDLDDYQRYIKSLKDKYNTTYDIIVSKFISNINPKN